MGKAIPPLLIGLMLCLYGCGAHLNTPAYRAQYAYLKEAHRPFPAMQRSDYFVIFLVNARHLDYTDTPRLLRSIAKHPNGTKNGDVGHAWIYLQGKSQGKIATLEGGHSGELGLLQAKYFDGLMNGIDYGRANPTEAEKQCPIEEPNPIKYLWETQRDGFFQRGSGGHRPTFAAKVDLTEAQFQQILHLINAEYPFRDYAITHHQCCTLIEEVAALAGLEVEHQMIIRIDPCLFFRGRNLLLWKDPAYALFPFSSPDRLERSLIEAVVQGRAEYALSWYQQERS
jgi:hypothetical protein